MTEGSVHEIIGGVLPYMKYNFFLCDV